MLSEAADADEAAAHKAWFKAVPVNVIMVIFYIPF
jgi:hypothetical protein